jgi:hypothetical protein
MSPRPTWTPGRHTPAEFARLSGDHNPIHTDPTSAREAGFDDVVVHGMCVLGATQQAVRAQAPEGWSLRRAEVRFASAVLPDQPVTFDLEQRPSDHEGLRIDAIPRVDGRPVLQPARFLLMPAEQPWPPEEGAAPSSEDVLGDAHRLGAETLEVYRRLVDGTPAPPASAPPLAALLGMHDALAKTFASRKPARPGHWIHLRLRIDVHSGLRSGLQVRCRIRDGATVLRSASVGIQLLIPYLVEEPSTGSPVASGTTTLLYRFARPAAR